MAVVVHVPLATLPHPDSLHQLGFSAPERYKYSLISNPLSSQNRCYLRIRSLIRASVPQSTSRNQIGCSSFKKMHTHAASSTVITIQFLWLNPSSGSALLPVQIVSKQKNGKQNSSISFLIATLIFILL